MPYLGPWSVVEAYELMLTGVPSHEIAVVVDVVGGSDAGVDAVDCASRHSEGVADGTLLAVYEAANLRCHRYPHCARSHPPVRLDACPCDYVDRLSSSSSSPSERVPSRMNRRPYLHRVRSLQCVDHLVACQSRSAHVASHRGNTLDNAQ